MLVVIAVSTFATLFQILKWTLQLRSLINLVVESHLSFGLTVLDWPQRRKNLPAARTS